MTGVVFIFVREDASEAEALAESFDAAGYFITGNSADDDALSIVLWSRAAVRSSAFRHAADVAMRRGRAIVASLSAPPPSQSVFGAPIVDLSAWNGENSAALDPLFAIADRLARPSTPNVIRLPSRVQYEDAEFSEGDVVPTISEDERIRRARQSWEVPIPTDMLKAVREERPTPDPTVWELPADLLAPTRKPPKIAEQWPRRDFPRAPVAKRPFPPLHIGGALAAIGVLFAGALWAGGANPPPQQQAERGSGVTLTAASTEFVGLPDLPAPLEAEEATVVQSRAIEPPSTPAPRPRATRRASAPTPYASWNDPEHPDYWRSRARVDPNAPA